MRCQNENNASRCAGFTLIEIVVVLLIFAIVVAMAAAITRGVVAAQKRALTTTRMQTVDTALVQFVMQQKRLPCPADGSLLSSDASAGLETRPASGSCGAANQKNGVVPWRTLGITETDATDGWDHRLTYRTDPQLTADGGLDMSSCDPAGTEAPPPPLAPPPACNPACVAPATLSSCTPPVNFLRGRGLTVKNLPTATNPSGVPVMDPAPSPSTAPPAGAAYVVVSPGESGGGAYFFNSSGSVSASTVTDGTEEKKNYVDQALQPNYVDDLANTTSGATHFDDIVSHPSVMTVVTKAGLQPRSH